MLEPQRRSSLYDVLRAPAGTELDCLVATTYSASLGTVLSLPAAMLLDGHEARGRTAGSFTAADLAALRRVCSRTMIFCQGGAILPAELVPPAVIEAEEMVHEVTAPNGGSFHPKVWVMRFARMDGGRPALRIAVMSRNLTGEGSWDAGIVMDAGAPLARRESNDLGNLLRMLPGRCLRPPSNERRALVEELADTVEGVKWRTPPDVGPPSFHLVGGRAGGAWSQPASERLAIVSPFLTAGAIRTLLGSTGALALVASRGDALDGCWPALADHCERKMVLAAPGNPEGGAATPQLHAKMLLWERGKRVRLAIGSMNATTAAITGRNVEFMVSVDCTRATNGAGVDALLDHRGIGAVLEDFAPADDAGPAAQSFDDRPARLHLLAADLHLDCAPEGGGWRIDLVPAAGLDGTAALLPGLRFRPVTLGASRAAPCGRALERGEPAHLPGTVDLAQITGFTFFEADGPDGPFAFTLNLPVRGASHEERRHAALRTFLPDHRSFDDFLRVLLGDFASLEGGGGAGAGGDPTAWRQGGATGLLELLVRCAADDPDRLRSVRRTLDGFSTEELESVAPEELRTLWAAVTASGGAA